MMNIKNKRGFTLLEILVVLVILGLVSGLLLQGLSYTMLLREKIQKQLGQVQISRVQEFWFRKSVESFTLPEKKDYDSPLEFEGTIDEFSGNSLFSLDAPVGVVTIISWRLQDDDNQITLEYKGANDHWWTIASWFGSDAKFLYLDSNNQWHDKWPVAAFPEELPAGIALNLLRQDKELIWLSRILGAKKTPIDPLLGY